MTECTQESFEFTAHFSREVVARFDGGTAALVFTEFDYQTRESWSRARRVVAKAEQLDGKANPRFVVTNLSAEQWAVSALYEQLYCARGEMENRIKEQLSLFATHVSAESMRANQLRLSFAGCAYVLMHALRRLGLQGTVLEHAQATTVRNRAELDGDFRSLTGEAFASAKVEWHILPAPIVNE